MQEMNLEEWVGKTVGEMLDSLPAYDEMRMVAGSRPGILEGANYRYGEKWLMVRANKITHQPTFNARHQWDAELFREETIGKVYWDR